MIGLSSESSATDVTAFMPHPDTHDLREAQEAARVLPIDPRLKRARARIKRPERRQARRWRICYQRPTSVTCAALFLAAFSAGGILLAPFTAMYEQMYGLLPLMEGPIAGLMLATCLLLLPFGFLIGQARNWARWGFVILSALLIGGGIFLSYPAWDYRLVAPAALWLLYLGLLFNPSANCFFR